VPKTLSMMNAEAHRLGAYDTHAATPSGLDGPRQATSAYDLALILRAAIKIPDFCRYNTTMEGTVPAQPPKYGSYKFANDNKLTWNYKGVLASKNGYTDAARHTYVGAAQHGNRRLIVTLMHGERQPVDMWQQAASLLDWGFALPAGVQPVGRLVEPGEVDAARNAARAKAKPAQSPPNARAESTPVSHTGGGSSGIGLVPPIMGGVAVLTVLLVGALAWRSRRPRY
jgi:serine-type D-Ala-D-Ala carboxypeptidase (penicillin-binding protein 5/6)